MIMRRHARSENQKIVRKPRSAAAWATEAEAPATEIGWSVYPLRAPQPPAPISSVGGRRSTRVFVPKAASKTADGKLRAHRTGKKRVALVSQLQGKPVDGEGEWKTMFNRDRDGARGLPWRKGEDSGGRILGGSSYGWNEPKTPKTDAGEDVAPVMEESPKSKDLQDSLDSQDGKRCGVAYNRKRPRGESSDGAASCSVVSGTDGDSSTEKKRLKASTLMKEPIRGRERETGGKELRIRESSWKFAKEVGILVDDILPHLAGSMVLIVLVKTSSSSSQHQFLRLLIRARSLMKKSGFKVEYFAAFAFSRSSYLSEHGVHILPLRWQEDNVFFRNFTPYCGLCKFNGDSQSGPLLWVNFLALPLYFKSLHISLLLGSPYLPFFLVRYLKSLPTDLSVSIRFEENDSHVPEEISYSGVGYAVFVPAVEEKESQDVDLKLWKHKKSRSSLGRKAINTLWVDSQASASIRSKVGIISESKKYAELDVSKPLHVEVLDTISQNLFNYNDESNASTPLGSHEKQTSSLENNPAWQLKQKRSLESALPELEENLSAARCNTNVLVTVADRCWREEGCEVMLHLSDSRKWCLAIKGKYELKYFQRPQNPIKSLYFNRFTRSYMWTGEDGLKLEFVDKLDRDAFLDLNSECCYRNLKETYSTRIDLPTVYEVSGYEDYVTASFVPPMEYIRMTGDEVQRALASKVIRYDMDSEDEDLLVNLNSSGSLEGKSFGYVSEESFEKVIYAFEKDAYCNMDDILNKERALDLFQELGNRDVLSVIHDYWIEKRSKKSGAIFKVFKVPTQSEEDRKAKSQKKRASNRKCGQTTMMKPKSEEKFPTSLSQPEDDHKPNISKKRSIRSKGRQAATMKPKFPELTESLEMLEDNENELDHKPNIQKKRSSKRKGRQATTMKPKFPESTESPEMPEDNESELDHKPTIQKKKRSSKRKGRQAATMKPEFAESNESPEMPEAGASENASQTALEKQNLANRAVEVAIQRRSRAQMLMENADLAVYQALMALRKAKLLSIQD